MSVLKILSFIPPVLLVLFAYTLIKKTVKGMKRGAYLEPCYLGVVLISALCAFILTPLSCKLCMNFFADLSMEKLYNLVRSFGVALPEKIETVILSFDIEAVSALLPTIFSLLAPILFVAFYSIFNGIFSVIFKIVRSAVKITVRCDLVGKIMGGVLGAIEGALVFLIFTAPFTAISNTTVAVVDGIKAENESSKSLVYTVDDITERFNNTTAIKMLNSIGAGFLTRELSQKYVDESDFDLSVELASGLDIFNDSMHLVNSFSETSNPANLLTPENKARVESITRSLQKSKYLPLILSGSMRAVSDIFFNNLPKTPETYTDKLLSALSDFLSTAERESVTKDVVTMKELLFYLDDMEVLDSLKTGKKEDITLAFGKKDEHGNSVIKNAIEILKENPRSSGIISTLNEISIMVMCNSLGVENDVAVVYDSIKTGFTELVSILPDNYATTEEYKENIKETLNSTLMKNDIQLKDEVLDNMTEHVSEYLEESRENGSLQYEMTDEDVTEIILSYYDAYIEYKENGKLPENLPINPSNPADPTDPDEN